MRHSAPRRLVVLTIAVSALTACSPETPEAPRASDLSTLGGADDAAGGDLLCGAIPEAAAQRVTSGQRIVDSDGEVRRYPDGAVGSARCEVYVSGQEAPAIRLLVNTAVAGGQDAVLRASGGRADPLPESEGLGYVSTADPEPERDGGLPVSSAGGELLVESTVPGSDDPLRILVEVKVSATGRDQAEDVVALLGQVRRVLEFEPLVELPDDVSASPTPAG